MVAVEAWTSSRGRTRVLERGGMEMHRCVSFRSAEACRWCLAQRHHRQMEFKI